MYLQSVIKKDKFAGFVPINHCVPMPKEITTIKKMGYQIYGNPIRQLTEDEREKLRLAHGSRQNHHDEVH